MAILDNINCARRLGGRGAATLLPRSNHSNFFNYDVGYIYHIFFLYIFPSQRGQVGFWFYNSETVRKKKKKMKISLRKYMIKKPSRGHSRLHEAH